MLWRGCSLEGVVGVGRPTCSFVLFLPSPAVKGHGCHITIRGPGSPPAECSTVSSLLNRHSEVQPLSWQHYKTAEESEKKKKTSDDCIIIL